MKTLVIILLVCLLVSAVGIPFWVTTLTLGGFGGFYAGYAFRLRYKSVHGLLDHYRSKWFRKHTH